MNQDCIFCKIITGELPSAKVYEDDDALVFMNLQAVSRGHSLVIPKKHFEDILETPTEDLNKTLAVVRKVATATMKAFNTDSFTVSANRGEASHRTVLHLHFHVIPRYQNDSLHDWPHQEIELMARAELAELIKKNL